MSSRHRTARMAAAIRLDGCASLVANAAMAIARRETGIVSSSSAGTAGD